MAERALIFQAESIRGIQRFLRGEPGAKSVTRRIMKPQQPADTVRGFASDDTGVCWLSKEAAGGKGGLYFVPSRTSVGADFDSRAKAPWEPCDILRVKEGWAVTSTDTSSVSIAYKERANGRRLAETDGGCDVIQADHSTVKQAEKYTHYDMWQSPMFMPRWASRYWLHVCSVRAERLQDITEADAILEGVHCPTHDPALGKGGKPGWTYDGTRFFGSARHCYEEEFNRINGKGSWERDPWVWRIEWDAVQMEAPKK